MLSGVKPTQQQIFKIRRYNNMKKHENAIKMLMKNAVDCSFYGYYESENGTRYLTNGHLIIKLFNTYSTVTTDFVGDLPRLNDTNFLNKLVDFVEAHKNGDHRIQLYMPNVKMWDKYNDTDNCYKLEYDKNKYIGFSADYMKRLYTLTGDNCITIIDSKSPIYISGVGIECVFLPCWLDDNYNADNYEQFKEELRACYIQDAKTKEESEKKKALKNTDKIEKDVIYNGFTMWIGGKQYFLMSDKKRVTDEITKDFLKLIAANTTINVDKISESDFKYIKNGINSATIAKTTSYYGNEEIYRIETKYNSENFYKNEYDRLIIYNGNMEKIDICADDITATNEETTNETTAADVMSATDTDTAATKDMNTDLKTIETPVILRYSDYEHIRIKKGYYINVRNYDYIIYQKQATSEYTIYNLNYMMPYGYDNFKTVTDAVNHLNDTADKQNEYYNIHNHYTKQEIYNIYASYNFYNKYELVKQYVEKDIQPDHETPKQTDKPHKASKTAISLFVVTDKPQPVKLSGHELPTLKQLDRIPMYVERFKTDFKQRNNARVYKYRVNNKKPLKKAHNDFVGTVSCYNDKCASGGDMVAVNSS